jgi:hypothetical protein
LVQPGVFALFDVGPSPQPDVIEVEMFTFWAVTLQMGHTVKTDWRTTGRNLSSFAVRSTDKQWFADDIVTQFGFCT